MIDCNNYCVKQETLESTKFRCVGEDTREKWYPQCESYTSTFYGLGKENSSVGVGRIDRFALPCPSQMITIFYKNSVRLQSLLHITDIQGQYAIGRHTDKFLRLTPTVLDPSLFWCRTEFILVSDGIIELPNLRWPVLANPLEFTDFITKNLHFQPSCVCCKSNVQQSDILVIQKFAFKKKVIFWGIKVSDTAQSYGIQADPFTFLIRGTLKRLLITDCFPSQTA